MITLFLCVDAKNGLRGSFLMDHTSATIDEARQWFVETVQGMKEAGFWESEETPVAVSFARKTMAEIEREFPIFFYAGREDERPN